MPDPRLDSGEEIDEEEDEEVSDSPLPAWLEGDSLAPPCQVSLNPFLRIARTFLGTKYLQLVWDDVSRATGRYGNQNPR